MPNNGVVFPGHQREAFQRYEGRVWPMPNWKAELQLEGSTKNPTN